MQLLPRLLLTWSCLASVAMANHPGGGAEGTCGRIDKELERLEDMVADLMSQIRKTIVKARGCKNESGIYIKLDDSRDRPSNEYDDDEFRRYPEKDQRKPSRRREMEHRDPEASTNPSFFENIIHQGRRRLFFASKEDSKPEKKGKEPRQVRKKGKNRKTTGSKRVKPKTPTQITTVEPTVRPTMKYQQEIRASLKPAKNSYEDSIEIMEARRGNKTVNDFVTKQPSSKLEPAQIGKKPGGGTDLRRRIEEANSFSVEESKKLAKGLNHKGESRKNKVEQDSNPNKNGSPPLKDQLAFTDNPGSLEGKGGGTTNSPTQATKTPRIRRYGGEGNTRMRSMKIGGNHHSNYYSDYKQRREESNNKYINDAT